MNANQTCLALLLALTAINPAAFAASVPSISSEKVALIKANPADHNNSCDYNHGGLAASGSPDETGAMSAQAGEPRMFSTLLPDHVVYWRAGSFTPATSWGEMTAQASNTQPAGLVLDLRSNSTPADFQGALRIASFLIQGQTGLAFYEVTYAPEAAQPRLQSAPTVIVLTDRQTRGAAESLAAALQARGALVMGQATAGKSPVVPDVTTPGQASDEAQALALIDRRQVDAVISEDANRHRMCEAALVRGQDPEQDSFIAAHEAAAPAPQSPVAHDLALVEALDSLKAIRVVQGEESSPSIRVADTSSAAGQSVIASAEMGR